MEQRLNLRRVAPDAMTAVLGLEQYVRGAVDHTLLHLVKLRASILNGCAYCVDMHSREAADAGEDPRRLFAVAAWRESPFFSEEERAALALTDAVTRLGDAGVPDDVWTDAESAFGTEGVANLVVAIATINVWNRIAVTFHTQPPALAMPPER
jgi:AhpD family alkylhydroperoxidase